MGTQSLIGVMHGSKFKAVTCHYDGYLRHMGVTLFKHYNSAKANHLVSLGHLASVKERVVPNEGEAHDYDNPAPGVTISYNIQQKPGVDPWLTMHSFDELSEYVESYGHDYVYIMREGVWYFVQDGQLATLESVLTAKGLI